jgi:nitrate reductase NapA
MNINRREFLKSSIAASTAATVGMPLSEQAEAAVKAGEKDWQWDKGGVPHVRRRAAASWWPRPRQGRMVATKGDPDAPVNKRAELHQGLLQRQDGMYGAGPADPAPVAHEGRQVRQVRASSCR